MPAAKIQFEQINQDTHDYDCFNKNEAFMVSRIGFSLEIQGVRHENLSVEVRQPYGTDFETTPLEVGPVQGYRGSWNHSAFSDLCEAYYRQAVGSSGCGIRIVGGGNIRMKNNTFVIPARGEIEIPDGGVGSW